MGRTVLVVLGCGTALGLMSTSMGVLPFGTVYAIWAGVCVLAATQG